MPWSPTPLDMALRERERERERERPPYANGANSQIFVFFFFFTIRTQYTLSNFLMFQQTWVMYNLINKPTSHMPSNLILSWNSWARLCHQLVVLGWNQSGKAVGPGHTFKEEEKISKIVGINLLQTLRISIEVLYSRWQQGKIQNFQMGVGGGSKRLCVTRAHYEHKVPYMVSHAICMSLIVFKAFWYKTEKMGGGGGAPVVPPSRFGSTWANGNETQLFSMSLFSWDIKQPDASRKRLHIFFCTIVLDYCSEFNVFIVMLGWIN